MELSEPKPGPQLQSSQFSLAAIFILTAAFAFILGLVFVFPDWLAGPIIVFLILAVPAVLAVCAKYGPDSWTAFCVGALVPTGTVLIGVGLTFISYGNFARAGAGALSPTATNQLLAFGQWLAAIAMLGIAWRPIALTSWAVATLIGILCVNVRRFILRRKSA
jgi:hypothetical protein